MPREQHPLYRNQNPRGSDSMEYEDSREDHYRNMTAQEYEESKNAQVANQDAVLDDIHRGVKGLKAHANAINEEVTVQNGMIDAVGERMDSAQAELEREEAVARLVTAQRKKSCKLYTVVAILTVILVVLYIV